MNSRELIDQTARRLWQAGIEDSRVDAALLLNHVTGIPPLELRLGLELPPFDETAFERLVAERLTRRPLQYILGSQPFYGHEFLVDERVLIPRQETELLAEAVLEYLLPRRNESLQVLDLCCGSGCIGLSVALAMDCQTVLLDLSEDALAVARLNAERLRARRCFIIKSDLYEAVAPLDFHVIVSNPPYIPSRVCDTLQAEVRREPLMALDGGPDGLALYRRIIAEAPEHLHRGGQLFL